MVFSAMAKRTTIPRDGPDDRPTMADIARRAGVSVSTVSRALAGSPRVTAATRRRIARLAGDAGYVLNQVAQGLRLQRSRQLLVILPTIANPFFAEVVLGVEEEAQAHGYGVLVGNTSGAPEREAALGRHLQTGVVDGLLVLMGRIPSVLSDLAAAHRVVAISERVPGSGIATVTIDNAAAAQAAIAHLLALGHRRIAHVMGRAHSNVALQRAKGYRLALQSAAIEIDERLVVLGDFSVASGEVAMHRLFEVPQPPTAVFCGNDEMAVGVIKAARARRLRVPADLSVVGFDDVPIAAAYDPSLTTIQQPRHEMGRAAAALLIDQLAHKRTRHVEEPLPFRLIVRESTAHAPPSRVAEGDAAPAEARQLGAQTKV
jgi:LacI family repressor for deo operon, udp, cdd, tsx, nupC, and nupG